MTPVLTRYLYHCEEVCHSLLTCLLVKSSFEETLFWASEIYYSGYQKEIWELLWKIYYDFFAIRNPKFEKKIKRAHKNWCDTHDVVHLIDVINFLYHSSTPTLKVFYLRTIKATVPTSIYLGRTPKWVVSLNLSKKERYVIRSIHKKSLLDISYYLSQISDNIPRCYEIVWHYYTKIKGYSLKNQLVYEKITYTDKKHILYALICYLMMETDEELSKIRKIALVRKLEQSSIDFFKETNISITPIWKTLPKRRLYAIHELVGAFPIERAKVDIEWNKILWYHWEYYARQCPLWAERFKKYKVIFDETTLQPKFINDDLLEEFYEKYNLEPDEQSRDCQEKSLRVLKTKTLGEWLSTIFSETIDDAIGKQRKIYYSLNGP